MFIVLSRGRPTQGLETVPGIQELTLEPGTERVFVLRRELKKD